MSYVKGLNIEKLNYERCLNRVREDYFDFKNQIEERNKQIENIMALNFS